MKSVSVGMNFFIFFERTKITIVFIEFQSTFRRPKIDFVVAVSIISLSD